MKESVVTQRCWRLETYCVGRSEKTIKTQNSAAKNTRDEEDAHKTKSVCKLNYFVCPKTENK